MLGLGTFLYAIFMSVAWIMTLYTLNFYYLSYQSQHNIIHQKRKGKISLQGGSTTHDNLPVVTVQLPIYNEKYVAARIIDAVCLLDYPKDKLEIQILDDSDDETFESIKLIGWPTQAWRRQHSPYSPKLW